MKIQPMEYDKIIANHPYPRGWYPKYIWNSNNSIADNDNNSYNNSINTGDMNYLTKK